SGAMVANATVDLRNPVSGFARSTATDSSGKFSIPNVPFNPYHLTVSGEGFAAHAQDIDVRSLELNAECSVLVYDRAVVESLRATQERYFAASEELTVASWARRPLTAKLAQNVARLFDSFL
ncbi:MAG: carboxypeptidase regulatory-like domain-containing protein, partial [Chloroflexota bacterium]|nr:carboxypeptidase regulatory-like domain-containing protein [Chloroflexota bacterium]